MQYPNYHLATFVSRPNRFIAWCDLAGEQVQVHVKNTGRNREILRPGVPVSLVQSANPKRKTKYDLVAAKVGERWINIDSQAPNHVALAGLEQGIIQLPGLQDTIQILRPEVVFKDSRFDIYGETAVEKFFVEIKGVTLANGALAAFPDAPTSRASKHVTTLMQAAQAGYRSYLCFIVQLTGIETMTVFKQRDPVLYQTILTAQQNNVGVLAYGCHVTPGELTVQYPVALDLKQSFIEPKLV
ncbi:DNA/RNA nuclease SfsA [Loigolactobacillus bifermentans]|jgi:sugar fermentation stimulation protein A|uniref:Sugar fermentation stimulation protein homolog n=1 Tax=Loigolactobacillus bifermentans DSM 20003 TaxID=1423726 RepID=A0A0R1H027_9LACO|nr:DNA/RNA nuclease SfsA [Loigolactobacillus bifermentans]KRK39813.1 sugar fermentation stimulation protein [Loigolactobacillus bifermentans DSM 20003]QGG60987.1 DNA/RNA nuclease SfsA [Loigolactobacillus bifermentans]